MARIKGGIKKRKKEEEETIVQKRIKELSKSLLEKADTKGVITDKEMEFFQKLLSKKNK